MKFKEQNQAIINQSSFECHFINYTLNSTFFSLNDTEGFLNKGQWVIQIFI